MRIFTPLIAAAVAITAVAAGPAEARRKDDNRRAYADCRYDKRNAGHQGIAVGAVAGGAGTALLGGNVGTSLLGAAAGGALGSVVGRSTEKCGNGRYRR